MKPAPIKNFGWNDDKAPFYHECLLPVVESFLPPPRTGLFWISVVATAVSSIG